MAERSADSIGPQNDHKIAGVWAPNDQRAPDALDSELLVVRSATIQDGSSNDPTAINRTHQGDAVAVPYPEATYWGRLGKRIFSSAVSVLSYMRADTTLHRADITNHTADTA
jgi:hypothetical protein